jgi:hypothetical protein
VSVRSAKKKRRDLDIVRARRANFTGVVGFDVVFHVYSDVLYSDVLSRTRRGTVQFSVLDRAWKLLWSVRGDHLSCPIWEIEAAVPLLGDNPPRRAPIIKLFTVNNVPLQCTPSFQCFSLSAPTQLLLPRRPPQ